VSSKIISRRILPVPVFAKAGHMPQLAMAYILFFQKNRLVCFISLFFNFLFVGVVL
jgi:hypothetical protein